jgi:phage/plasmid-associated DNA primase
MGLPTPAFDSLLKFQNLPVDAQKMLYVMIGRLRYPMNVHDRWQVVPFIKGMAGTGKSTIGKYVTEMFEFKDIGVLSSNMEEKFGIAALLNKFAWVCMEVKERFGLPQSEFQSMISGEHMSIPVKYGEAQATVWDTPGLLLGNEMGNWLDAAGSMTRRLLIWEFYRLVAEADPTLDLRLRQELGVFIRKVNEAYRSFTARYGDRDIWKIPEAAYFMQTKARAKGAINPIVSFIQTSEVVRLNVKGWMPFRRFQELYSAWAREMGKPRQLQRDHWLPIFSDYNFKCEVDKRVYNNRDVNGFMIDGLEEVLAAEPT